MILPSSFGHKSADGKTRGPCATSCDPHSTVMPSPHGRCLSGTRSAPCNTDPEGVANGVPGWCGQCERTIKSPTQV